MAACVGLMLVSLTAFGAGNEVGYADWVPPLGAYLFAVPVSLGSATFARAVWRRTQGEVRVQKLRLLGGLAAIAAVIAITVAYAVLINDPDSYRGRFNQFTQKWEPNFGESSFLTFTLLIVFTFPCGGLAALIKVLYLDSIQAVGLSRPSGIDPIGEILRTQAPS